VQHGAGAPFTITFGTNNGANEVNNRAELAARLAAGAAQTGLSLSINGAGRIVIASATDEVVEVSGTPATLAALGLAAQTAQGSTTPSWELFYQESSTATGTKSPGKCGRHLHLQCQRPDDVADTGGDAQ
jgi:hypothetical protein